MDRPTTDSTAPRTESTDVQNMAKAAYAKSAASMGDINELAKGNVEAMLQSSKILAAGLQEMGSAMAADGRSMFETLSADVRELAAVKSPSDYLRLQSEMMRKMFDWAIAHNTKQAEGMRKLASESAAPLSQQLSLAADKVKTVV